MDKTVNIQQAIELSAKSKKLNKSIVLIGGCFDILHKGHIAFVKAAKKKGDKLFVMLESDETIRLTKGKNLPTHTHKKRASILSSLEDVDYVILLPRLETDAEYDELIFALKPDIIAITKGDVGKVHKLRQSKVIGADLIEVIGRMKNVSTTKLRKRINK